MIERARSTGRGNGLGAGAIAFPTSIVVSPGPLANFATIPTASRLLFLRALYENHFFKDGRGLKYQTEVEPDTGLLPSISLELEGIFSYVPFTVAAGDLYEGSPEFKFQASSLLKDFDKVVGPTVAYLRSVLKLLSDSERASFYPNHEIYFTTDWGVGVAETSYFPAIIQAFRFKCLPFVTTGVPVLSEDGAPIPGQVGEALEIESKAYAAFEIGYPFLPFMSPDSGMQLAVDFIAAEGVDLDEQSVGRFVRTGETSVARAFAAWFYANAAPVDVLLPPFIGNSASPVFVVQDLAQIAAFMCAYTDELHMTAGVVDDSIHATTRAQVAAQDKEIERLRKVLAETELRVGQVVSQPRGVKSEPVYSGLSPDEALTLIDEKIKEALGAAPPDIDAIGTLSQFRKTIQKEATPLVLEQLAAFLSRLSAKGMGNVVEEQAASAADSLFTLEQGVFESIDWEALKGQLGADVGNRIDSLLGLLDISTSGPLGFQGKNIQTKIMKTLSAFADAVEGVLNRKGEIAGSNAIITTFMKDTVGYAGKMQAWLDQKANSGVKTGSLVPITSKKRLAKIENAQKEVAPVVEKKKFTFTKSNKTTKPVTSNAI